MKRRNRGKYQRWEAARIRRIEAYDAQIRKAQLEGNQAQLKMLEAQREMDVAHTAAFWQTKWNEVKRYAASHDIRNPIKSKSEFISIWMTISQEGETKDIMREIKYGLEYDTSYKVARAMRQKVREFRKRAIEEEKRRQAEVRAYEDQGLEVPDDLLDEVVIPDDLRVRDLQNMSTTDFAKKYRDQIREEYYRMKDQGMTSKDAGLWISNNWFGSA